MDKEKTTINIDRQETEVFNGVVIGKPLYTTINIVKYGTSDSRLPTRDRSSREKMEEEKKSLSTFLSDAEVKVVWREDSNLDKPPKVGRGKILNDDDNFVYLTGEKGTVIVNKKDIIAVKQLPQPQE